MDDERYQQALAALYTALNETKIYLGLLNRPPLAVNDTDPPPGPRRNEETEAQLSRLWNEASLKMRPFDHDLAERCLLKGGYWTDPDEWNADDVQKARIQIDLVFEDARRLL